MKCVLYGTIGCLAAAVVWLGWEQFHLQQRLVALQGSQPTVLRGKGDSTASSIEDLKARLERTRIDLSAALQGIAQTSAKVDTLQQAMEKLNRHVQTTLTQQQARAELQPPPARVATAKPEPIPAISASPQAPVGAVLLPLARTTPPPAPIKRPSQWRRWGPEQATGPPDTMEAGDLSTAWAPLAPNTGTQWLLLDYERPVSLAEVKVRETFNPGAICKVTALTPEGKEVKVWEGRETESQAPKETSFPATTNVSAQSVKVYLDTSRVAGWNEIDAVELVGTDGSRQWAVNASASSSYADR